MLHKATSEDSLNRFKEKYHDYITKESSEILYMRCFLPGHTDKKRSACLYTGSGVYSCPVCGSSPMSRHLDGVKYEYTDRPRAKPEDSVSLEWNFDDAPLHYQFLSAGVLHWVNATKDETVHGRGWRCDRQYRRIYGCKGIPGFRLFAPILCESTTDAMKLLENGIDAGSICSVKNIHHVTKGKIYIPQNDPAGIRASLQAVQQGAFVFKWYMQYPNIKDIRELSEDKFKLMLLSLENYRV